MTSRTDIPVTSVLVFSLTSEQIRSADSLDQLEEFFMDVRFPFAADTKKIYILTRFPIFLIRKKSKSTKLRVMSYPLFILTSYFHRRRSSDRRPNPISFLDADQGLKGFFLAVEAFLLEKTIHRHVSSHEHFTYLIATQTYFNKVPRFFEASYPRCRKAMIWYSVNSQPIFRKGDKQEFTLSSALKTVFDLHFAWNDDHREWMNNLGIKTVQSVGSMVFLPRKGLRQVTHSRAASRTRRIVFFDVTPKTSASSIYSAEASIRTLTSIVKSVGSLSSDHREVTLSIKPKRAYSREDSKRYIETLNEMYRHGKVELLSSRTNLYDVIQKSELVIAAPHSSPAFIAREMEIPSIFYFLPEAEWELPDEFLGISSIQDESSLIAWMRLYLR